MCTHTQIPSELVKVAASTPELFVDAEGISLSRTDELSIFKLYIDAKTHKHTYLINAHILGIKAFTTKEHQRQPHPEIDPQRYSGHKVVLRCPDGFRCSLLAIRSQTRWDRRSKAAGVGFEKCRCKLGRLRDALNEDAGIDSAYQRQRQGILSFREWRRPIVQHTDPC